jgi:coproporphyrinogen III oxidase-like Fe-S oxidoreductase
MSARSHLGTIIYRNHQRSLTYLERIESNRSPVEHVIELEEDDRKTQFVTSTLGDGKPLDCGEYQRVFGTSFADDFAEPLGRLLAGGLIAREQNLLRLTWTGQLLHDRVTLNFYPPRVLKWLAERRPAGMGMVSA